MASMRKCVLILCAAVTCLASVQLVGKPLLRGKVFGKGVSVAAKSLNQCMELCSLNASTCDGVVFHEVIGKCRLIRKCGSALQVDNSTNAIYYSKRPLIQSDSFFYSPASDSCIGYISEFADYAESDNACSLLRGRLAIVDSKQAAVIASKLLTKAQRDFAWIGENQTGNRVLSRDGFVPEILEQDTVSPLVRYCWAINYRQQWGKFPCKNVRLPALCEILPFPV